RRLRAAGKRAQQSQRNQAFHGMFPQGDQWNENRTMFSPGGNGDISTRVAGLPMEFLNGGFS
ncbi:hypothetical protein, partial [Klebsiella variicola]|uniref:hypothetical protein n=1 Tax=Klebsiella variicola TaxID=244366 RepID=UPI001E3D285F